MEQSRPEVGLVMTLYSHMMDFTYKHCMQEALLLQACSNHSKPHSVTSRSYLPLSENTSDSPPT